MIVELNLGLNDERHGHVVLVRQLGIAVAPVLLELRQATDAAETLKATLLWIFFFTRQPPYNNFLSLIYLPLFCPVALVTHVKKRATRRITIIAGDVAYFRLQDIRIRESWCLRQLVGSGYARQRIVDAVNHYFIIILVAMHVHL